MWPVWWVCVLVVLWLAASYAAALLWWRTPRRPPPDPAFAAAVLAGVAGIYGAVVVRATFADPLTFYAGLLVLALGLAALGRRGFGPVDPLGLERERLAAAFPLGLTAYAAVLPAVLLVHFLSARYVVPEEVRNSLQEALLQVIDETSPTRQALLVVSITIAVPIFEETVYRGLIQGGLRAGLARVLKPRDAAIVAVAASAAIFTLLHPPFTWAPIFSLGLALGALFERTRSLWSCFVFHAAHNAVTLAYWL